MQESKQNVTRTAARGKKGVVSAARRASAQAGIEMLELGGNAVDAAVAAAFVAGVIEPMETCLAGSGFMLIHDPATGRTHSVEFAPRAPAAAQPDMFTIDEARNLDRGLGVSVVVGDDNVQGIRSSGIPATLCGLAKAVTRFGRLPLKTVLKPAIRAAYDGFDADPYYSLEALANLEPLRANAAAAGTFLVNGDVPVAAHLGEATLGKAPTIRQQALGRTLETLALHGAKAVHEGEIGDQLGKTFAELGAVLTRDDLRAESVAILEARRSQFRDHEVWGATAPSGSLTQAQMLNIWSALYPGGAPSEDTIERIRMFEAMSRHAFADRYHWLGDADYVAVPEAGLLSAEYAKAIATKIRDGDVPRGPNELTPWEHFSQHSVNDPWAFDPAANTKTIWNPRGATEPTSGTTHVSVIDGDGMGVALTHTAAGHFGSKVVCSRTGLLLDCAMGWFNARPNAANSIAGRKRPLANMGPMLVTRNGQVTAAVGCPGGRRIVSCVVQLIINLVERKLDAEDAVRVPRLDASGHTLLASEELATILDTQTPGSDWLPVAVQHSPFGYELARPVLATRDADGSLSGVTDPGVRGSSIAL